MLVIAILVATGRKSLSLVKSIILDVNDEVVGCWSSLSWLGVVAIKT